MRHLLPALLLIGLVASFLAPIAAATPPYTDCNDGVVVGGKFTGVCGNLNCGALVVNDMEQARWGSPSC